MARYGVLKLDHELVDAIIEGTTGSLSMAGLNPPAIGASSRSNPNREFAVIVGLVGKDTGSMTINMSRRALLHMAGALMAEQYDEICEDAFDAVMEIGNMIAGGVKSTLEGSRFEIRHLSLPSMVLGASYNVYYSRGMSTATVEFELDGLPLEYYGARFFSVSVSLLRGSGN